MEKSVCELRGVGFFLAKNSSNPCRLQDSDDASFLNLRHRSAFYLFLGTNLLCPPRVCRLDLTLAENESDGVRLLLQADA
jgi:hypothetical protein